MLVLLSAGSNAQGQLGNGTVDDSHTFQACSFAGAPSGALPPNCISVMNIATGSNHTLALLKLATTDGERLTEVWGCGDGRKGQLGPEYQRRCTDQEFTTLFQHLALEAELVRLGLSRYKVTAIGATWETSYLVLSHPDQHDVVLSFGSNEFGDLGIGVDPGGKTVGKGTRVCVVDLSCIMVEGKPLNTAQKIHVERIRTGQRHVILSIEAEWVDKDPVQVLLGWGASRHGQLGGSQIPPSGLPPVRPTRAKTPSALAQPTQHSRPVLIMSTTVRSDFVIEHSLGIHHSVFLHASGLISYLGSSRKNQTNGLDGLQDARDIKCTWNGTYILTTSESPRILSTGSNSHGQLGRREDAPTLDVEGIPVMDSTTIGALVCGSEHSLISVSSDGGEDEVWGWGWNEHGNLGIGHTADSPTPVKVWPSVPSTKGIQVHPVRGVWAGNGSSWICCGTPDGSANAILITR